MTHGIFFQENRGESLLHLTEMLAGGNNMFLRGCSWADFLRHSGLVVWTIKLSQKIQCR